MALYHYQIISPERTITATGAVRAVDATAAMARIEKKEALSLALLPGQRTSNSIHILVKGETL